MLKKTLRLFLALATFALLVTACEKESIQPQEETPIDARALAKGYLSNAPLLPFAVLDINYETNHIDGFFMDRTTNIRTVSMDNVSYLNLDEPTLMEYFLKNLYEGSEAVEAISPLVLADKVRQSTTVKTFKSITTEETKPTSKIYFAFTWATQNGNHSGGSCADGDDSSYQEPVFNKVVLAATGRYDYQATTKNEKELVTWLQSFEETLNN